MANLREEALKLYLKSGKIVRGTIDPIIKNRAKYIGTFEKRREAGGKLIKDLSKKAAVGANKRRRRR